MTRVLFVTVWAALLLAAAPPPAYQQAKRKIDLIQGDKAPAKAVYSFNKAEIEAWATVEVRDLVPDGFRNPRIELGSGRATGRALIDFMKLRHAKGAPKNWFLDTLLKGERPVAVTVNLQSADGMCTVNLERLEISGIVATGSVLDFLIKTFFYTLFPDAKIGEPFVLRHRVDSIAVRPEAAYVKLKNIPPPAAVTPPAKSAGKK